MIDLFLCDSYYFYPTVRTTGCSQKNEKTNGPSVLEIVSPNFGKNFPKLMCMDNTKQKVFQISGAAKIGLERRLLEIGGGEKN